MLRLVSDVIPVLMLCSRRTFKLLSPALKGPEDDSIRIETCCPNTIKKHNKGLLCLTNTSLYIYIRDKHFGMANNK